MDHPISVKLHLIKMAYWKIACHVRDWPEISTQLRLVMDDLNQQRDQLIQELIEIPTSRPRDHENKTITQEQRKIIERADRKAKGDRDQLSMF